MMPGMPDLQSLLQQAQQMQADMARAQSDLAQVEVTGHAGGGLVTATVTGDGQLKALEIDPSVVDPADVETLADLVIAAVRDATRSVAELAEQSMGSVAGALTGGAGGPGGFDLSAFGLPSLDGLLDDDDEEDDDEDDLDDEELGDDEVDDEVTGDDTSVPALSQGPLDTEELNDMVDADVVAGDVLEGDVVEGEVVEGEVVEGEVVEGEVLDGDAADRPAGQGPDSGTRPPSGA